ncbi:MAG: YggS family pyridoxal phosphate-dependent enzyme [Betaproteobacteria bacterium]|nr:YggS family pyridoxal phosphate-dependent enzyme [Betaproteobacteria bacterium]
MRSIHDNLQAVRSRIARAAAAAGREAGNVTLLAVSKTQPAPLLAQAFAAGQRAFGENYVQEAAEKMDALRLPGVEWHLIGPLQSNKTRLAAARFDWVQTLDSEKIARRLSGQRSGSLPPLNVLIQVNVSGEASKSGVAPAEVLLLAKAIKPLPRLRLRGLMAIPEPGADAARYQELKGLYDGLKDELRFDTLSLGMSDDLELAIACGATMVRIGTAIFGARARSRGNDVPPAPPLPVKDAA